MQKAYNIRMQKKIIILCIILKLLVPGILVSQQSQSSIPELLRIPERSEAPRYPVDMVIGTLGRGNAPLASYNYVRNLFNRVIGGYDLEAEYNSGNLSGENRLEINSLRPRSFRLGGGRIEADGYVSFLIRLLGSNESITGEIYLKLIDEAWVIDDLFLEERRTIGEIRDSFLYDFSPYERFY